MNELQLWWLLLLPVFFGVGWVAARIDMRQVVRASSRLPRIYLTGLNHLLHDELDQAIEAFLLPRVRTPPRWNCSWRWRCSFAGAVNSIARSAFIRNCSRARI